MKKKIFFLTIAAVACTFAGCDIDRLPSTSMAAEDVTNDPTGNMDILLNGAYSYLKDWSDPMHRCGEYAGDNMMIRGTSTDAFYEFITYSRTPQNSRLQTFWDYSYKVIAQTSNIIKMIPEGQSADVDNKLGECYFLRGLLYFYLCRAYGRPYYQSPETNLGVPIVNGTPADITGAGFKLPDRATVKETYAQAISDLNKAAAMLSVNQGPAYASKEAAWAMLSRIYLYMSGTWANPNVEYAKMSEAYADSVISSGTYSLLGRADFMKYNELEPENNSESIFVVKRMPDEFSGYDYYYTIGGMYSNIGGMGWGEMYASAKYLALLDETGRNDWYNHKIVDARANFIEPQYDENTPGTYFRFIKNVYDASGKQTNYNYVQALADIKGNTATCTETINSKPTTYELTPVDAAQGIWSIKYSDGNTYTGVMDHFITLNRVYPMFYIVKCSREGGSQTQLHSPVITRLGEIYLNKAEAAAKQGDYAGALVALNTIRERSLPGQGYTSLDATTAPTRIDKERQLELAYQAERSYDVYRNGGELTRRYPGPHNAMEVIEPTDYRVVYFIPQNAINAYPAGSTLTQNPTSN
ncbi:MAG: RagB/SusD family nutrient uptake outer membrane protein [Tannerella sp.]|nr:RagB/SusD family nutrient uptake outer membrane protein [Tannerella sp.]